MPAFVWDPNVQGLLNGDEERICVQMSCIEPLINLPRYTEQSFRRKCGCLTGCPCLRYTGLSLRPFRVICQELSVLTLASSNFTAEYMGQDTFCILDRFILPLVHCKVMTIKCGCFYQYWLALVTESISVGVVLNKRVTINLSLHHSSSHLCM